MTKYSKLYEDFDPDQKLIADQKEIDLYLFIGKYVVGFQSIEDHIEKILYLARGWDNWNETGDQLDRMNFFQKADLVHKTIKKHPTFIRGNEIDGWFDRVDDCFLKIDNERKRRNSILHAQYIFEPIAIDGYVIQNVGVKDGDVWQTQNLEFTPVYMKATLIELSNIAMNIAFVHKQCIHLMIKNR
jgi:hypothetical protein